MQQSRGKNDGVYQNRESLLRLSVSNEINTYVRGGASLATVRAGRSYRSSSELRC